MRWGQAIATNESDLPDEAAAEAELLSACVSGDQRAMRQLYEQHVRSVMQTARRLGLPPAEVEDVAQEVFTVAFREIHRVRPGSLAAWLFRMVSNRVNDRHRRRRFRETFARIFGPTEEPSTDTTPEADLLKKDAETRVGRILARMSQKKREVFVLFELEGVSGEDIARKLGIPVDTVWTRLFHARREFAKVGRALELVEHAHGDGAS